MANGIGRVWAANAGDDEQRPNGVGSVWIENIDALTPSGGASEEQINELSAAIDYVSANAGDQEVDSLVHSNSATWNNVSSNYVPRSGVKDYTYLAQITPYSVNISSVDNYNHTSAQGWYYSNGIGTRRLSAGPTYNQTTESLDLYPNILQGYKTTAVGSAQSGSFNINYTGLYCSNTAGNANISTTDSYLFAVNSNTSTYQSSPAYIRFDKYNGPSYSATNPAIGQFFVTTTGDAYVPRGNPAWIVKNASGDGFSIGASEARGFDKDGNTIWSTKQSKASQITNGAGDSQPPILIVSQPASPSYSAQWGSAPHISANAQNGLEISYGSEAPTTRIFGTGPVVSSTTAKSELQSYGLTITKPSGANAQFVPEQLVMNSGTKHTYVTLDEIRITDGTYNVYVNPNDVRVVSGDSDGWSLSSSIQKRELSFDENDAITAINGSAIRYPNSASLLPYPMEFVSTSSEATGANILYVVTGSN